MERERGLNEQRDLIERKFYNERGFNREKD